MRTILVLTIYTFSFLPGYGQPDQLMPHQMQQDLDILYASWTNLHPGLYRYLTPNQLEKIFGNARNFCKIQRTEKEFYLLLAGMCEKIKCGHSFLNPTNLSKEAKKKYLPSKVIPLLFIIDDKNNIIITTNLTGNNKIKTGDQLISINGISAKRIIDSLLGVSRSDGGHATGKKLYNINETADELDAYSLFDIFFPLFFKTTDKPMIRFTSCNNRKAYQVPVQFISPEERENAYEKKVGKIPSGRELWDFKILANHTAYMKFGTFAFWNDDFNTTRYIDSVFNITIADNSIRNLIIDIRNNEGGDNSGDYILSYITKNKIACDGAVNRYYRYLSIPDSLKKYLDTWDPSFKKDKDPSLFEKTADGLYKIKSNSDACNDIIPQNKTFKGKVYLITNAKNSSAGFEMAKDFKENKLGTIVGETTGGSLQGINGGEFFFMTLPNSKIEIDIPLIFQGPKNPQPDTGIQPDVLIKTTQKDICEGKDAQLNYIFKQIQ